MPSRPATAISFFTSSSTALPQTIRVWERRSIHSGRSFFDVGKGKEPPDALRRRFTRELKWCTDMIDVFRPAAE